jgi:hypothetical protein
LLPATKVHSAQSWSTTTRSSVISRTA